MKVLCDTHSFLWLASADKRLGRNALRVARDDENELFVSIASPWEVAIKVGLGKLEMGVSIEQLFGEERRLLGVQLLPIELAHVTRLATLPPLHRDPFDRLLVCQALVEGMAFMSADASLERYGVRRVW